MLNRLTGSRSIPIGLAVAIGLFLVTHVGLVHGQSHRGNATQRSYYNGFGGRMGNHSYQHGGGFSNSRYQSTYWYPTGTRGPQYYQWTNWRATPYQQPFPQQSLMWGNSNRHYYYGGNRYYGTQYQINRGTYYNPFGQTRWNW